MATVRVLDVVIPEVYQSYSQVDDVEKTAFFQSGIVTKNDMLDKLADEGGATVNLPFWRDLDPSQEPNLTSDNPLQKATPNKIATGKQVARKAFLNQWYSAADLAGELAGSDPNKRIRERFSVYWQRQWQRRLIATAISLMIDNATRHDGDMLHDISVDTAANITTANLFNRKAFTGAAFTLGDMVENLGAIAVHSMVYKRMVDNDDIDFVKDSSGSMVIAMFMGKRVIVDDGMPVMPVGTGTGFRYTSILFAPGAFAYGGGTPHVPFEVERQGLEGNGGGVEYMGERKTWLIHPFGYKVAIEPSNPAGFTLGELNGSISNPVIPYERVVDRKHVPLAFLITNG